VRGTRHGVLITSGPDGVIEEDTFACGHCGCIVTVKPMCDPADMGGRCTCCDSLICKHCVDKGCDPMEKKLDRWEARARLLESMRAD